jgi:glycosyltransferase involved in cell wall biosynthesis
MLARQYRKKIVFDVDDAIHLTFPCFAEYIANCSKVFAGSHALIDYYKRFSKNVTLIPSSVDTDVIRPLSHLKSSATVIGWHGSAFGHLENLNLISSVFKKLSSKFDLVFRILGTAGNLHLQQILLRRFEGVRLEFGPDYWFAYEQLPHYMATVDIAVYPLVNTYWNRSKCSMKLLEYMAMELPSCSSRVGENAYIVSDGLNGFLASNQDEWMVRLKRLIDDKELRIDMGKKAKAQVDKTYSVERVSQEISDLIENA